MSFKSFFKILTIICLYTSISGEMVVNKFYERQSDDVLLAHIVNSTKISDSPENHILVFTWASNNEHFNQISISISSDFSKSELETPQDDGHVLYKHAFKILVYGENVTGLYGFADVYGYKNRIQRGDISVENEMDSRFTIREQVNADSFFIRGQTHDVSCADINCDGEVYNVRGGIERLYNINEIDDNEGIVSVYTRDSTIKHVELEEHNNCGGNPNNEITVNINNNCGFICLLTIFHNITSIIYFIIHQ